MGVSDREFIAAERRSAVDTAFENSHDGVSIDLRAPSSPVFDAGEVYEYEATLYLRRLKPLLDFVGALVLLLLTLPITVACAVAVYVSMGGPVILRQQRVGRFGRVFTVYKFRTMQPDRRQYDVRFTGPERRTSHKREDDPRITSVGRFLRKWSLDELPQWLNVLRGEMSLVGPRPELPKIVAGYERWQHRRHVVRPGITGLWQVSERSDRPLHECTHLDLEYVERASLALDVELLLRTPLSALGRGKGF